MGRRVPGNDESAGKRRSGKTRKGLQVAARDADRVRQRRRPNRELVPGRPIPAPSRPGRPLKAVTAVGHSILTAAWHMLQTGEHYRVPGGDYFTRQNPDRLTRRLIRQLEALGHDVTLQPREVAA